jgi:methyl-accepting chemotaxis protein
MIWVMVAAELVSFACGITTILLAGNLAQAGPWLGAVVAACALVALACLRSIFSARHHHRSATAQRSMAPPVALPTAQPMALPVALDVASPGTAQDMQTAMRLFGSAIVDQVDTSVSTVLTENHQMREMASEMASAAEQAKDQFRHSMERAVEAEGGIEQLNSFSTELASSIRVIGSAVKNSIATVKDATAQAAATRSCVETMAGLSSAVSDVVKLIDGIARQTRMLALNATIEATRAGDAGRGFAVVASEVKQLAHMTAEATQSIGQKISEMSGMVTQSVAALHALVATIESVDSASGAIGDAIGEQERLAAQVSTSLQNMRDAVFSLSREIREAAQIAANSGMLSDLVLETANSVDGLMTGLKDRLQGIAVSMGPAESLADAA